MNRILKTKISGEDLIYNFLPADYKEAFEARTTNRNQFTADDLMVSFWTDNPSWINALFKLRNILVRPFKLQQPETEQDWSKVFEDCIRSGKSYNIMSIPAKSEYETVICLTDSHLTAYISISLKPDGESNASTIKTSTLVQFHNTFGRCYFYVISPFHYLIVKSKIKQAVKKLSL
jgi:hypothetical protein